MPVVHQVLSGAGPFDAVTNEALAFRALFERWGWAGRDVAATRDPRVGRQVGELRDLRAQPDDVLLLHYSAYAPRIERVLALPNRKVLLSHNVTPARWLWGYDAMTAVQCALGEAQLARYVAGCEWFAADSAFNAADLRAAGAGEVTVLPVLADPARLGAPDPRPRPPGPPQLLFVGRLMPHKRQDEVIRAFALYRAEHAPDARLTLVGEPLNVAYGARLHRLAERLAPGAVAFEGGLSPAELADRYRAAHAFVCLSEHEGFCIPVLEALHFGVPVVARARGAVPEIAGDAALMAGDDDLAVVAELIHLAVTEDDLRAELRRRGSARVAALAPAHTETGLKALIERVLAS